jgi:hypothetical protein
MVIDTPLEIEPNRRQVGIKSSPVRKRIARPKPHCSEHDESTQEWEVEEILDQDVDAKTFEKLYEVKWKGYEESTWEPAKNLSGCKDAIKTFETMNIHKAPKKK